MSEWIKWGGGECPVHANTFVDLKYRCGEVRLSRRGEASSWVHSGYGGAAHGKDYDIVEYRLSRFSGLEDAYDEADRPVSDSFQERALGTQVAGNHYLQFEIQPVTYINANNLDFLAGNVVKYISRHKLKGKKADVEKAIHFCKLILELQYEGE